MSRSRADQRTTRVAVLGAATPSGALVRAALAHDGVAGSRVDLFGEADHEAVLSDYGGEARLIQPPDPEEVLAHDVIFLCESGEAASRAIASAGAGRLVLDLVGALALESGATVVHPDVNPEAAAAHRGLVRVPHAISCILADALAPIERAAGVRSATAFVLRPAADFGELGLEELRDQTLGLLRFDEAPKSIFGGRQLAFNVIAQAALGAAAEPGLEARIAAEVTAIVGWSENRLAVSLAVVPVFHGHMATIRVESMRPLASDGELGLAMDRSKPMPTQTPIEADESAPTAVVGLAADGLGGFWVRVVAGQASASLAARAVRWARTAGTL